MDVSNQVEGLGNPTARERQNQSPPVSERGFRPIFYSQRTLSDHRKPAWIPDKQVLYFTCCFLYIVVLRNLKDAVIGNLKNKMFSLEANTNS